MTIRLLRLATWVLLIAVAAAGCSQPPDAQIVELAREQAARQAEHHRQVAELQKEITVGSRNLVESDAEARRELVQLQRDLREDQHEIGRQRDSLEVERKEIARNRFRDQAAAATFSTLGLFVICGLPLLLCIYVLRAVFFGESADPALTEVLVDELTSDEPRLLSRNEPPPHERQPPQFDPECDENWDDDGNERFY